MKVLLFRLQNIKRKKRLIDENVRMWKCEDVEMKKSLKDRKKVLCLKMM
jgi:hypothetical protein